jgi:hypothetical protein
MRRQSIVQIWAEPPLDKKVKDNCLLTPWIF